MDTFGLSYTSAMYHVWNACNRQIPLDALTVEDVKPTSEWSGRESFGTDYFKPSSVPSSRRGKFSCLVVQATDNRLLTEETAATYLKCSINDYRSDVGVIRDICEISTPEK